MCQVRHHSVTNILMCSQHWHCHLADSCSCQ